MPDPYMPDFVIEQLRHDNHRLEQQVAELQRKLRALGEHSANVDRAFVLAVDEKMDSRNRLARLRAGGQG